MRFFGKLFIVIVLIMGVENFLLTPANALPHKEDIARDVALKACFAGEVAECETSASSAFGENCKMLKEVLLSKPLFVRAPIVMDKKNIAGEEFSAEKILLSGKISLEKCLENATPIFADSIFEFIVSEPAADAAEAASTETVPTAEIYVAAFYIDATSYVETDLKLFSQNFCDVYLNDEKIGSNQGLAHISERAAAESLGSNAAAAADASQAAAEGSAASSSLAATSAPLTCKLKLKPATYRLAIKFVAPTSVHGSAQATTAAAAQVSDASQPAPATTAVPALRFKLGLDLKPADSNKIKIRTKYEKSIYTLDDVLQAKRPADVSISASGKYAMLSYTLNGLDGKSTSSTEIREISTNKVLLRSYKKENWKWMPKQDALYFINKEFSKRRLVLLDVATLQETTLDEDLPEGENCFFDTEDRLLIEKLEEAPKIEDGGVSQILSPSDRLPGDRDRKIFYLYNLKEKIQERIFFASSNLDVKAISPDGGYLVATKFWEDFSTSTYSRSSTYLVHLKNGFRIDTIFENLSYIYPEAISPDGKQIVFLAYADEFNKIGKTSNYSTDANEYDLQVFLYNVETKQIEAITKDFAPSVQKAQYSTLDKNLYITAADKDDVALFRYNYKNKNFEKIETGFSYISKLRIAKNSLRAVGIGESPSVSPRFFTINLKTGQTTSLDAPMQDIDQNKKLAKVEKYVFESSYGEKIDGRVYLPYDFEPTKKYPLIVYFYGGTTPSSSTFDGRYPFNAYAALGYVVYVLQPSGCIGYGQEFSARHVNAWGKRTAEEIIEGTKAFCKDHSFIDPSKIACIGASYGGFMSMYLQTQTDIFAAAISHAGISDISSYWGEGYWGYSYNSVAAKGSFPWSRKDIFVEQSPLFMADKINTPLLLLHGTSDVNVPIGESIQMFNALKILGKEVELITVEGEDHHILDYERRKRWQYSIFAFLAKHLQGDDSWWKSMYR